MSLDFSNAFNSLSRRSIHRALLQYMPELMPYFQSTYCTYSNLHFGNNILSSSSGVKQGDPLGPLLFCLAIHPILLQIQEMFPSLKMIAYMDDVVLIADLNIVEQATVCFKELFTKIGFQLNLLKCVLLSNSPVSTIVDEKCICSNSPQLTLRHALNCSKLITYRSSLHDAVRDTVFNTAQTARISCITEPLLKETLSLNNFGSDDRGDVYCDWIDNSEAIIDFVSCNAANDTLVHRRKLNPVAALDFKAKEKHRKYDKDIEEANVDRNTQLVFIAFPFSINGRLSVEAETFLDDFQKMVQEKTMRRFDIFLWRSRIQFAIINRLPRFFNRIREALARQQADQDFVEEILVQ
ncbi:hypothetical protein P9112_006342 [Eukaryota sp. TZLM1-RC]